MSMSRQWYLGKTCAASDELGFTLLEVLVAFVVLAIGLATVSTGIVLAVRSDERVKSMDAALLIAQSRLDEAGIIERLAAGRREGFVGGRYRWSQTTIPMRPAPLTDKVASAAVNVKTFWVTVAVEAADGTRTKLSSLKVSAGAEP